MVEKSPKEAIAIARSAGPRFVLSPEERADLEALAQSRTAEVRRVERARILLAYADTPSFSHVARTLQLSRTKVTRCVLKACRLGVRTALDDLPRPGRPRRITAAARAWIIHLACQKPKDVGWPQACWSEALLARYVREHAEAAGHPSAAQVQQGTISKLLAATDLHPHRVRYYLQRRDPDFDRKMVQVLHVYEQVTWAFDADGRPTVRLSYDEKPGIQALGTTAPDRPPVPGEDGAWQRDHEYVRHGTVSLLAAIDLATGEVTGLVRSRHRSQEFIEFLRHLDARYPRDVKIQIILDNHSAHTSRETQAYLATVPHRFDFVFTPKHASWLNIIEVFFAKLTKQLLQDIRVASVDELHTRIVQYLDQINADPVPFRWKWKPQMPLEDAHAI